MEIKVSKERAIHKPVRLVKISNACFLFSRQKIQKLLDQSYYFTEFSKNPLKEIYITKDFGIMSYSGRKVIIEFIQAIKYAYINKSASANFNDHEFPRKLYVDFILLKNFNELKNFMQASLDFCVFPDEQEERDLLKEYKYFGVKKSPVYRAYYGFTSVPPLSLIESLVVGGISTINLNFIWDKHRQLKKFITNYLSNNLREEDMPWLYRQLENSNVAFTDQKSMTWKRVNEGPVFEGDDRSLDEIVGMKHFKKTIPVEEYRAYGHFALCCLEVYLDMQKDFPFFTCAECGQLNYKGEGSKRMHCTKQENPQCVKDRQVDRRIKSDRFKNK